MSRAANVPLAISKNAARNVWLRAQRLDEAGSFVDGADATRAAIEHLGYLQIDTINVIERCHHHILWSRIAGYRREHLRQAQSVDKTVFEYWTHALSYVPTRDLPFFLPGSPCVGTVPETGSLQSLRPSFPIGATPPPRLPRRQFSNLWFQASG